MIEAPSNICFQLYHNYKKKKDIKGKNEQKMTMKKVIIKREKKTSKIPSLWPITAYCTKFRYILLEWHGLLLRR